jgi:hypothetical protein
MNATTELTHTKETRNALVQRWIDGVLKAEADLGGGLIQEIDDKEIAEHNRRYSNKIVHCSAIVGPKEKDDSHYMEYKILDT